MLPLLLLDVTLQIARKTNVHTSCDRSHLNLPRAGGEKADSHPSRRKPAEKLSERLGKARTSDVEALRAELRAGDTASPASQKEEKREAAQG